MSDSLHQRAQLFKDTPTCQSSAVIREKACVIYTMDDLSRITSIPLSGSGSCLVFCRTTLMGGLDK